MEQKIDLDALEAALEKSTPGEWRWGVNGKRVQVAAVRHAAQVCAVWNTSAHPAPAVAHAIVAAHNALPALIAELRELRARTTPEVIGEKHRDGNWWMVWDKWAETWRKAKWSFGMECWVNATGQQLVGFTTHALPMPPATEAQ